MTAPAPRGHHSTDPQHPDWATKAEGSIGQPCLHPDVIAAAAAAGITRDRDLRHLQRTYDRMLATADADHDFGGHVLTMHDKRTRQTRPVDLAVGERATRRLDRSTR